MAAFPLCLHLAVAALSVRACGTRKRLLLRGLRCRYSDAILCVSRDVASATLGTMVCRSTVRGSYHVLLDRRRNLSVCEMSFGY